MFDILSWIASANPDVATNGGVVPMIIVFVAIMVPCVCEIRFKADTGYGGKRTPAR